MPTVTTRGKDNGGTISIKLYDDLRKLESNIYTFCRSNAPPSKTVRTSAPPGAQSNDDQSNTTKKKDEMRQFLISCNFVHERTTTILKRYKYAPEWDLDICPKRA